MNLYDLNLAEDFVASWKIHWAIRKPILTGIYILGGLFVPSDTHAQDSITILESKPGTCIEAAEGDTFYVDYSTAYLGERISFCTDRWNNTSEPVQLMIAIDRSGSMATTDANRRAVSVAKMFVDSLAVRSPLSQVGIVLFPGKTSSSALSFAPLSLNDPANVVAIKAAIDNGANRNGYTPYGAALDSCLQEFSELPFSENRAIIFLSDGKPDPLSNYQAFLNAGKLSLLPPTHTVYLYKTTGDAATHDTLAHLAAATGGTFSDVNDANYLATIFLDTLLTEVTKVVDIGDFYLVNPRMEQFRPGELVDTSTANPIVLFQPLTLLSGVNPVDLLYTKVGPSGDTLRMVKSFYVVRTDSIPPSAGTNALFSAVRIPKSNTQFTDMSGEDLGSEGYDSTTGEVWFRIQRWPALDNVIQIDSAMVYTASGDSEVVAVLETGKITNTYTGSFGLSTGSAHPLNGVLNVSVNDRVWIVYRNGSLRAGSDNLDVSNDTARVTRPWVAEEPPLPRVTYFVRPQSVIACTTSDVSYKLEYTVPESEKYALSYLRVPQWLTPLGNMLVGVAPSQAVDDSVVVAIASSSGADTMVLGIHIVTVRPGIAPSGNAMLRPMVIRAMPNAIRIQLAPHSELFAWDPMGRLVLRSLASSSPQELSISRSNRPAGVYILRTANKRTSETVRVCLP